ncbi:MAG TPA: hypothetical protein HPP77_11190 [Candidatus Hydrogenedentes bacterium]|nr:hypothetical protein [Candidatus Hydrogenedentota bacterium]HIJ74502.1 hypothetical protein [Candidatus Hydrogenedentota bacterium]
MKHSKLITRKPMAAQGDDAETWQFRQDLLWLFISTLFSKRGAHGTL